MFLRITLALMVVGLTATPAAADPASAKEHYQKGMAEFMLDHYDRAIAEFEQGFRDQPLPAFLYNIARAHDRAGHLASAIDYYRKYLELAPSAPDRATIEARIADLEQMKARAPAPKPPPPPKPTAPASPAPSQMRSALVAPAPKVERRSLVKRPWFWVTIGSAVAVIGAGVALGVVFGRRDPTPTFTVGGP